MLVTFEIYYHVPPSARGGYVFGQRWFVCIVCLSSLVSVCEDNFCITQTRYGTDRDEILWIIFHKVAAVYT